uniref:CPG4 domain-containing protein n=1 Tax=Steinernema glaseri TaxID=37863 RepID=A0A1I7ZXD4_9BILA
MGTNVGLALLYGLFLSSTLVHAQSTGHCQRYQNCIYETRQHYIACMGGIGTAILLDHANNLEAHRLLAYHDNWKSTCLKESSTVEEVEFTRRAALRHQSMMECFGKPHLLANTNMTEEKHLSCSGIQTELSGFGSVFQTAAEPNECSMIYQRVLKRCDILADCCPQYSECSKRTHQQYLPQHNFERDMATKMLDCLKEGPKFVKDLPPHIAGGKGKNDVSFKDLPPEVQNELIQNSFDKRHSPQNDASPPAHIAFPDPAPPAPPSPPGFQSSSPSSTAASTPAVTSPTTSEPAPPTGEFDPVGDFLKKHTKSSDLEKVTKPTTTASPSSTSEHFDPVGDFLKSHPRTTTSSPSKRTLKPLSDDPAKDERSTTKSKDVKGNEVRRLSPEKTTTSTRKPSTTAAPKSPSTPALPTLPTLPPFPTIAPLPAIPTLPPPEKAWNDLVRLLFPGAPTPKPATTTKPPPTTTTVDPVVVAKKKKEHDIMDRKMRFLNQFYCAEYMKCEDIVNDELSKCEEKHSKEHEQYGIPNTKMREELLKNSNATNDGIKAACLAFITETTVNDFTRLQIATHKIDNDCTSQTRSIVLPMSIIEQCDESLHYKPEINSTTEEAENLTECVSRAYQIETRCKAIKACCPQNQQCVNSTPTGAKERLQLLWAQLKMEQSECEIAMAQTIEKHQKRLDRYKFRFLSQ